MVSIATIVVLAVIVAVKVGLARVAYRPSEDKATQVAACFRGVAAGGHCLGIPSYLHTGITWSGPTGLYLGGLLGWFGWFYSRPLGGFLAYATNQRDLILAMRTDGRKIVISPDPADEFVEAMRRHREQPASDQHEHSPIRRVAGAVLAESNTWRPPCHMVGNVHEVETTRHVPLRTPGFVRPGHGGPGVCRGSRSAGSPSSWYRDRYNR